MAIDEGDVDFLRSSDYYMVDSGRVLHDSGHWQDPGAADVDCVSSRCRSCCPPVYFQFCVVVVVVFVVFDDVWDAFLSRIWDCGG